VRVDCIPGDRLIDARTTVAVDGRPTNRSDVLVRAVRITNDDEAPARITGISFTACAGDKALRTIAYAPVRIVERAGEIVPLLEPFAKVPDNERAYFGTTGFWDPDGFAATCDLRRGASIGFMLEHLVVLSDEPVDRIVVAAAFARDGTPDSASIDVPVAEHRSPNEYAFPVRGAWRVINNWDDVHGHRDSISQEFAIDLVQPGADGLLPLDAANEDYAFYGCDVRAAADGVVVVVKDFCPENPRAGARAEIDAKAVYREHGLKAVTAGNYVIVEHAGGECSFYAHLIRGSIPVREGDRVTRGDVLGALGNSGNSDAPHLHFHVMAGADLGARGLPCRFVDLVDTFGERCPFITHNLATVRTHD